MKALGDPHRILPRHGIRHEQHFLRCERLLERRQLGHHGVVDLEPSGRIHQYRAGPRPRGRREPGLHQLDHIIPRSGCPAIRRAFRPAVRDTVYPDADGGAELPQLVFGRRAIHVGRHQKRRFLLALEPRGELGGRGRLARPLQAHEQHDRRWHRGKRQRRLRLAEQRHQLVVHDLDELLPWADRLERRQAHGLLPHPLDERAGQLEGDVRLEQHASDLAKPVADIRVGQHPAAREPLERRGQILR